MKFQARSTDGFLLFLSFCGDRFWTCFRWMDCDEPTPRMAVDSVDLPHVRPQLSRKAEKALTW